MVVHGQLVQPAVCLSDLYDVFVLDTVRDTRQNLWTLGGGGGGGGGAAGGGGWLE